MIVIVAIYTLFGSNVAGVSFHWIIAVYLSVSAIIVTGTFPVTGAAPTRTATPVVTATSGVDPPSVNYIFVNATFALHPPNPTYPDVKKFCVPSYID